MKTVKLPESLCTNKEMYLTGLESPTDRAENALIAVDTIVDPVQYAQAWAFISIARSLEAIRKLAEDVNQRP